MPDLSRRRALQLSAAATALPLVNIHTAASAGRLTCVFWDHFVPAGNDALRKLVNEWAGRNHVDVQVDFITTIGNKIELTMSAEALARTGHDVYACQQWAVHQWADEWEPVDDVMASLLAANGPVVENVEYLGKVKGHWMAVPSGPASSALEPCGRISMLKQFAGLDVQAIYPPHEVAAPAAPGWTYDRMLTAAEACHKAGFPFALGCGTTTDSVLTWGTTFGAFGADLVDGQGKITVDSDNVRAVLEYAKKMAPFLPPGSVSFDDASNNRSLIAGKSALIWNPPSAWAVAKRDAPQIAADCWTFPNPSGPGGVRLVPYRPIFWGIWSFARNKTAAKELIHWLGLRPQAEALTTAVDGYDISPFKSFSDFKIWSEVGPPPGTVYNYPIRPWHQAKYYTPGSSAPPDIAVQMWNRGTAPTMVAKLASGNTPEQAIAWAKNELEGFM